jgi:TetR/AcrR family transcriptional regulator, ethionamide resistance regulator
VFKINGRGLSRYVECAAGCGYAQLVQSSSSTDRRKPGRKRVDPGVIIDALERLLAEAPLRDLNVEDIIRTANVSRATFYACFPTKFAVTTALFARVVEEVAGATSSYLVRTEGQSPTEALRQGVAESIQVWSRHRDILATVIENEHAVPELAQQLATVKGRLADVLAEQIEQDRVNGLAPSGYDATELSASLVECTFQLVYRSSIDPRVDRRFDARTCDVITTLWCGAVYRLPSPI